MRNIGYRIKQLREQNNYTQTQLAKRLGLSRSAVNAWEMGVSIPSTQYLIELSRLLNVSTDYILCNNQDDKELLDISMLDESEKHLMYTLLNQLKKCHNALTLLKEKGCIHSDDELYTP